MIHQLTACAALLILPIAGSLHAYATDMRSRGIDPWRGKKG